MTFWISRKKAKKGTRAQECLCNLVPFNETIESEEKRKTDFLCTILNPRDSLQACTGGERKSQTGRQERRRVVETSRLFSYQKTAEAKCIFPLSGSP